MGHFHFVPAIDGAGRTLFLINAQDIAEIGRSVPKDREVFAHALPEQAQHKRFRQRAFGESGQTLRQRLLHPAGFGDRTSTFTRLLFGVAVRAREHQLVFSAAALRIGFQRAISALSKVAR